MFARPVAAHHSAAMFDDAKVLELKGTVKEMQWKNPHVWIQVVVDDHGKPTEWSLEAGSPNTLSRNGWRSTTFKAGDEVTVRLNRRDVHRREVRGRRQDHRPLGVTA